MSTPELAEVETTTDCVQDSATCTATTHIQDHAEVETTTDCVQDSATCIAATDIQDHNVGDVTEVETTTDCVQDSATCTATTDIQDHNVGDVTEVETTTDCVQDSATCTAATHIQDHNVGDVTEVETTTDCVQDSATCTATTDIQDHDVGDVTEVETTTDCVQDSATCTATTHIQDHDVGDVTEDGKGLSDDAPVMRESAAVEDDPECPPMNTANADVQESCSKADLLKDQNDCDCIDDNSAEMCRSLDDVPVQDTSVVNDVENGANSGRVDSRSCSMEEASVASPDSKDDNSANSNSCDVVCGRDTNEILEGDVAHTLKICLDRILDRVILAGRADENKDSIVDDTTDNDLSQDQASKQISEGQSFSSECAEGSDFQIIEECLDHILSKVLEVSAEIPPTESHGEHPVMSIPEDGEPSAEAATETTDVEKNGVTIESAHNAFVNVANVLGPTSKKSVLEECSGQACQLVVDQKEVNPTVIETTASTSSAIPSVLSQLTTNEAQSGILMSAPYMLTEEEFEVQKLQTSQDSASPCVPQNVDANPTKDEETEKKDGASHVVRSNPQVPSLEKGRISIGYSKKKDKYKCFLCAEVGGGKKFEEHVMQHLLWKPYKCLYCSRFFMTRTSIGTHVADSHVGKLPRCGLRAIKKAKQFLEEAFNKGTCEYFSERLNDMYWVWVQRKQCEAVSVVDDLEDETDDGDSKSVTCESVELTSVEVLPDVSLSSPRQEGSGEQTLKSNEVACVNEIQPRSADFKIKTSPNNLENPAKHPDPILVVDTDVFSDFTCLGKTAKALKDSAQREQVSNSLNHDETKDTIIPIIISDSDPIADLESAGNVLNSSISPVRELMSPATDIERSRKNNPSTTSPAPAQNLLPNKITGVSQSNTSIFANTLTAVPQVPGVQPQSATLLFPPTTVLTLLPAHQLTSVSPIRSPAPVLTTSLLSSTSSQGVSTCSVIFIPAGPVINVSPTSTLVPSVNLQASPTKVCLLPVLQPKKDIIETSMSLASGVQGTVILNQTSPPKQMVKASIDPVNEKQPLISGTSRKDNNKYVNYPNKFAIAMMKSDFLCTLCKTRYIYEHSFRAHLWNHLHLWNLQCSQCDTATHTCSKTDAYIEKLKTSKVGISSIVEVQLDEDIGDSQRKHIAEQQTASQRSMDKQEQVMHQINIEEQNTKLPQTMASRIEVQTCVYASGDNACRLEHSIAHGMTNTSSSSVLSNLATLPERQQGLPETLHSPEAERETSRMPEESRSEYLKHLQPMVMEANIETGTQAAVPSDAHLMQEHPSISCGGKVMSHGIVHQNECVDPVEQSKNKIVVSSTEAVQLPEWKFFVCGATCGFSTLYSAEFRKHIEECVSQEALFCSHCKFAADSPDMLVRHMGKHYLPHLPGVAVFQCSVSGCNFATNILQAFVHHMRNVHRNLDAYTCNFCGECFQEVIPLLKHLHSNILHVVNCKYCSAKDCAKAVIIKHIMESHPDKSKVTTMVKQLLCKDKKENASDIRPVLHSNVTTRATAPASRATGPSHSMGSGVLEVDVPLPRGRREPESQVARSGTPTTLSAFVPTARNVTPLVEIDRAASPVEVRNSEGKKVVEDRRQTTSCAPEISLACELCSFVGEIERELYVHASKHKAKQSGRVLSYSCPACPEDFNLIKSFQTHLKKHSKAIRYDISTCQICQMETGSRQNVLNHIKTVHNPIGKGHEFVDCLFRVSNSEVVTCSSCQYMCLGAEAMSVHHRRTSDGATRVNSSGTEATSVHHRRTSDGATRVNSSGAEAMSVLQEGKTPTCRRETLSALGQTSSGPLAVTLPEIDKPTVTMTIPSNSVYKYPVRCVICNYSSVYKANLKRHMDKIHPKVDIIIENGGIASPSKVRISKETANGGCHFQESDIDKLTIGGDFLAKELEWLYEDHGSPYKCLKCSKYFHRRNIIHAHVLSHWNISLWKCSMCIYKHARRVMVLEHMKQDHNKDCNTEDIIPLIDSLRKDISSILGTLVENGLQVLEHVDIGPILGGRSLDYKLRRMYKKVGKKKLCNSCEAEYQSMYNIHSHILKTHLKIFFFKCSYCNFASVQRFPVVDHIASEHPKKDIIVCYLPYATDAIKSKKGNAKSLSEDSGRRKRLSDGPVGTSVKKTKHNGKKDESKHPAEEVRLSSDQPEKSVTKTCGSDNEFSKDNNNQLGETRTSSSSSLVKSTGKSRGGYHALRVGSSTLDQKLQKLYDGKSRKSQKMVCKTCVQHFPSKYSLHCHLLGHLKINLLACPYCNFEQVEKSKVFTHIKSIHPNDHLHLRHISVDIDEAVKQFLGERSAFGRKRKPCKEVSLSELLAGRASKKTPSKCLKSPVKLSKNVVAVKVGNLRKYKCRLCDYMALTKNSVGTHVFKVHEKYKTPTQVGEESSDVPDLENILLQANKNGGSSHGNNERKRKDGSEDGSLAKKSKVEKLAQSARFRCPKCVFSASRKENILHHMKSKHNVKKVLLCKYCDAWFFTKDSLKGHISFLHIGKDMKYKATRLEDVALDIQTTDVPAKSAVKNPKSTNGKSTQEHDKQAGKSSSDETKTNSKVKFTSIIKPSKQVPLETDVLKQTSIEKGLSSTDVCKKSYFGSKTIEKDSSSLKSPETTSNSPSKNTQITPANTSGGSTGQTAVVLPNAELSLCIPSSPENSDDEQSENYKYLCVYCEFKTINTLEMKYHIAVHQTKRFFDGLVPVDHADKEKIKKKVSAILPICKERAKNKLITVSPSQVIKENGKGEVACEKPEILPTLPARDELSPPKDKPIPARDEPLLQKTSETLASQASPSRNRLSLNRKPGFTFSATSTEPVSKAKENIQTVISSDSSSESEDSDMIQPRKRNRKIRFIISSSEEDSGSDEDERSATFKVKPMLPSKTNYCCHLCVFTGTSLYQFRSHLSSHGGFTHLNPDISKASILKCGFCGFLAENREHFTDHVEKHLSGGIYKCGYCKFDSYHRKNMKSHLNCRHRHKPEKFVDLRVLMRERAQRPSGAARLVNLDPQLRLVDSMKSLQFQRLLDEAGCETMSMPLSVVKVVYQLIGGDIEDFRISEDDM